MGKRQVTLADLAKELGISTATVSRALKNYPDISKETKERVLSLAKQWRYTPNTIAASLRNKESHIIGVIIPEVVNQFFSTVITGIMEVAYNAGYRVMICQSNEDYDKEVADAKALLNNRVDGVLVSVAHGTHNFDHFREFKQAGVPLVFFDKICNEITNCSKVVVDDREGSYTAVDHLIQQGYKRIAHIHGPLSASNSSNRMNGYLDALKAHDLPFEDSLLIDGGNLTYEYAFELGKKIAVESAHPDAIFAVTDIVAIGVMTGLKEAGKKIPHEVAVVGFNDWFMCRVVDPPLSSVFQPGIKMGRKAAELLLQEISQEKAGRTPAYETVVLPTDLKIRSSTLIA